MPDPEKCQPPGLPCIGAHQREFADPGLISVNFTANTNTTQQVGAGVTCGVPAQNSRVSGWLNLNQTLNAANLPFDNGSPSLVILSGSNGDALRPALEQTRAITKPQPAKAIVDRGYRGRKEVDGTEVLLPGKPKPGQSKGESAKMRARFRRRAAIEPVISHLKHQYRLVRCFLKGFVGDQINLLLAAAAWNLKSGCGRRLFFGFNFFGLLWPTKLCPPQHPVHK